MKLLVGLCVALYFAVIEASLIPDPYPESKEDAATLFQLWKTDYSKVYRKSAEEGYRFEMFVSNVKHINNLNKQHRGEVTFELNQFADMSPAEFRNTVLMPKRTPPVHPPHKYMKVSVTDPLPESFDWTEQSTQVVTSVKDQGSAGTCWAFSTIANIEGQWAMQGKTLTDLSVEQVVDCDGSKDEKDQKADCGVFGGWPFLAYQYIQKAGGLELWTDYSYCSGIGGGKGSCFPCPAPGYNKTLCGPPAEYCLKNESCAAKVDPSKFVPDLKVADWKAISQNETEIAAAMMTTGPLSVALDATMLQFYRRGVFAPFVGCSKTALDHAVLLVGWGIETVFLEKKPYWKVKNSWGERWGQKGYFNIKRGNGECGINTQVTSAVLQKA
ncbi:cathepsin L-like [Littorina saxatilis]|uniref:Uncharacterized protein n=1 Tax=Littorina saxatilis TaxID=31220 RepID=A0AAN9G449_9CAEN